MGVFNSTQGDVSEAASVPRIELAEVLAVNHNTSGDAHKLALDRFALHYCALHRRLRYCYVTNDSRKFRAGLQHAR